LAHEQITPLNAKKPPLLYLVIQNCPTQTFPSSKNPALATIDITIVEIPELTEQEQSDKPDGMATLTACIRSVG
jgi:hypothetical protein